MTPELSDIKDWAERGRAALYQVKALAAACGVSRWCLNHFFLTHTCLHPHEWLARLQHMDAILLLAQGCTQKDIAAALHYSDAAHFGRAFKRLCGLTPGTALRQRLDLAAVMAQKPLPLCALDQAINHTAQNG
jgi:AraC family transcriptional regulator